MYEKVNRKLNLNGEIEFIHVLILNERKELNDKVKTSRLRKKL